MKRFAMSVAVGAMALAGSAMADGHKKDEKDRAYEAPEFSGVYAAETYIVSMFPKGLLAASSKESGVAFAIAKYGAKDGVFWVKDVVVPLGSSEEEAKCAKESKGKYNYTIADGAISFTLVEDPCQSRADALNGATLTPVEPPADEE